MLMLMRGLGVLSPNVAFTMTFFCPAERLVLDRDTVVEAARTRGFSDWTQHFSAAALRRRLEAAGLRVESLLAHAAGTPHDPDGPMLTAVARG